MSGDARRFAGKVTHSKEVSHYLRHYLPVVESSDSPLLGSSDVIESLIGKAKQRLEANGRSELNKSILLIPCMCGELTHNLVAEALTTVRVQDVTTCVRKCRRNHAIETQKRVSLFSASKPGTETAEPLLIQDKNVLQPECPRRGNVLAECFFKAPDETPEELEHMEHLQLLHLYPVEEILVGPGIAPEELEEIFVEA